MIDVICLVFIVVCSAFCSTFVLDWKLRRNLLGNLQKTNAEYQEVLLKIKAISEEQAKALLDLAERVAATEFFVRKK